MFQAWLILNWGRSLLPDLFSHVVLAYPFPPSSPSSLVLAPDTQRATITVLLYFVCVWPNLEEMPLRMGPLRMRGMVDLAGRKIGGDGLH